MSSQPEITQRDLRMRSKEIMDAVEHGQAFTVTRDGRSIGELVPLRQRSTRTRSERTRMPPPIRSQVPMTSEAPRRGLLDTNIMILRSRIAPEDLPDEMAISAVTLAELSAGPHEVRSDTEQDVYFEATERARRLDVLQRAEHEFDPIPFDADAARAYGRVTAAVIAAGRKPRRRAVDLMIAATAIVAELPLYTTNPDDFVGLDHLVTVIPVTRPEVPNERHPGQ